MAKAEVARACSGVAFREALLVWLKIGLLSFGGPAGQIALMHRILVEEKKWLTEARFLHALNFCMVLPGPEAQQLATYVGWLLHGVRGGVAAGVLFILPGALIILAFSCLVVLIGEFPIIEGLFLGLKAAVLAIVLQAVARLARRTWLRRETVIIGIAAFASLLFAGVPFPVVVITSGVLGYFFIHPDRHAEPDASEVDEKVFIQAPGTTRAAFFCAVLWGSTILSLVLIWGSSHLYTQLSLFFSKMAMVSFGGAYAVLAYAAQQAVVDFQWLLPGEMMDGLALAETTPGPLILVVQHIGFLAAYRNAVGEASLVAGIFGAMITTWVTFLPSFLWIFAGAPYIEKIRDSHRLAGVMSGITSAVVGVMAHLAVWFAIHALFKAHHSVKMLGGHQLLLPQLDRIDIPMALLTFFALVLVFRARLGVASVLVCCALPGIVWSVFFRA